MEPEDNATGVPQLIHVTGRSLAELLAEQQRLAAAEARARQRLESIDPCFEPPSNMAEYNAALLRWRQASDELHQVNAEIGDYYRTRLEAR